MKQKYTILVLLMAGALAGYCQEERTVPITSFEDDLDWQYTGGAIVDSLVDELPSPEGVPPLDGSLVLFTEYDTGDNGWQWAQINLKAGNIDLSGMLEIHMWVYFLPETTGELSIDFRPNCNGVNYELGKQVAPSAGEWHELVFPIDEITSAKLTDVGWFGGFISPGQSNAAGVVFIDNIYGYRPAGIVEKEYITVYGFNEADPETGLPLGWKETWDGVWPTLAGANVTPSEGEDAMQVELTGAWLNTAVTIDAMGTFDRWPEVLQFIVDFRVEPDFAGSWLQSTFVMQSGGPEGTPNVTNWDQSYPEKPYAGATNDWKTITWDVDMSGHTGAFEVEGGWFQIILITNCGSESEGELMFMDNFRVAVPVGSQVDAWSLY